MILPEKEREYMFIKLTGLIRKGLPTEIPLRNLAIYVQSPIDIDLETNIAFERDLVDLFKMNKYLSDYDLIILTNLENQFRMLQNEAPCLKCKEGIFGLDFIYGGLQEDGTIKYFHNSLELRDFYKNQELKSPSMTR